MSLGAWPSGKGKRSRLYEPFFKHGGKREKKSTTMTLLGFFHALCVLTLNKSSARCMKSQRWLCKGEAEEPTTSVNGKEPHHSIKCTPSDYMQHTTIIQRPFLNSKLLASCVFWETMKSSLLTKAELGARWPPWLNADKQILNAP